MPKLLFVMISATISACATVGPIDVTPLKSNAALVPRDPAVVEVFASGPPARPHVDVAYLRVDGYEPTAVLLDTLRASAAAHGCDALVITDSAHRLVGGRSHMIVDELAGACIAYTDAAPSRAAAAEMNCRARRSEEFDAALDSYREQRTRMLAALPTCGR
jgi:hypothetical protein